MSDSEDSEVLSDVERPSVSNTEQPEDVPPMSIEAAKARRKVIRSWITRTSNIIAMNVTPDDDQSPQISINNARNLSKELIKIDDIVTDDGKVEQYALKLGNIIRTLEQSIVLQKQKQVELDRIEFERLKMERETEFQEEFHRLQLEEKRASLSNVQAMATTPKTFSSASSIQSNTKAIRLDLQIPPFDGSPCRYRQFEQLFDALVGNNPSYDDAAKYLYFKQLIGKHGEIFSANLRPTKASLDIVKDRMREQFDDAGRIRKRVKDDFQELPIYKTFSSLASLHQLIVSWEEGILALRHSGTMEEQIRNTYLFLMTDHLPEFVLEKIGFELSTWTVDKFISEMKVFYRKKRELAEIASKPVREAKPRTNVNVATIGPTNESNKSPKGPIVNRQSLQRSPPTRQPIANRPSTNPSSCSICNGSHLTIYCNSFDVDKRREIVCRLNLCTRCLRTNTHEAVDCRSKYVCPCGRPHSRVLCSNSANRASTSNSAGSSVSSNSHRKPLVSPNTRPITYSASNNGSSNNQNQANGQTSVKTLQSPTTNNTFVASNHPKTFTFDNDIDMNSPENLDFSNPSSIVSYYMTVVVLINGQKVRVLLDGGAGRSSIRESCVRRLGLATSNQAKLTVGGVTGGTLISDSYVNVTLRSIFDDNSLDAVLMVVPTLGQMSPPAISRNLWFELQDSGIHVSDTWDYHCKPIDIILGLEYVNNLWLSTEQKVTEHVAARNSIFGWTASGVTHRATDKDETKPLTSIMFSNFETAPIQCMSADELTIEEKEYLAEFTRDKVAIADGRITTKLPWLERPQKLGANKKQSFDRFEKLVKSLHRNDRFEAYRENMDETVSQFAEIAPAEPESEKVYYLPHHCVVRLDKSTSQLRIVFDGSAAELGYASLNDSLFKGVNSWSSLDLLISSRFGEHALIADIEKAFLQVKVHPSDRDALRFWWYDRTFQVVPYRFTSVPFGTSASPFLLYAAMQKFFDLMIADGSNRDRQEIASIIRNRFYVDDLVVAFQSPTPKPLIRIRNETIAMFNNVNMNVRKWRTNDPIIDSQWSTDAPSQLKLLGYKWSITVDQYSPSVDMLPHIQPMTITKRIFASILARIYDPLGFVMPYVVHLRLFLSKLWSHSLDWDEPVPPSLQEEALIAVRDADLVNKVAIDRNVLPTDGSVPTLLVYCDASKHAIGIVTFSFVNNKSKFILSRARINRLTAAQESKEDTIAKLELDALVMASEAVHHINRVPALSFSSENVASQSRPFQKVIICSDSLLNLYRLVKHPNDQKSWISIRVNKLAKLAPGAEFRHVPTKENPADIVSRGASMTDLLSNPQWFDPPPPSEFTRFTDEITTIIATMTIADSTCKCSRFGTYGKAISAWKRIARWIQRHLTNSHPSIQNLSFGKLLMIKYLQRQHFASEIDAISQGKPVDRDSVLKCFKCFIDEDGVLRLHSRLKEGKNLSFDQVKPIILPKKCHLVELIVQNEHIRLGHPGSDRTMYSVRDQYFALGLRRYVRKLVHQCMICKRLRGKVGVMDHGMIPEFRYEFDSTPFTNIGLDIFGPLKVAMKTKGKRYGVIFSCATTRAVHIEPIHDMTAKSVFQALLDFMARRGVPHRIYTDNGINLLAVKKQLICFLNQISDQHPGLELNIEWTQLTASSPWRGGFYERLIRTIKDTLIALTFGKVIDNETLGVTLHLIEARLNSRPLFVQDDQMITPSHFFAKRPLTQLPPIGSKAYAACDHTPLVKVYKNIQSHVNAVWNTWYNQYLLQLKSFHQNVYKPFQSDNLQVGDAVILKSNTPTEKWPFGVVDEVVTSEDGKVRTVYVRTHDRGNLTRKARDIRTLIPFECTREVQEEDIAHPEISPIVG